MRCGKAGWPFTVRNILLLFPVLVKHDPEPDAAQYTFEA